MSKVKYLTSETVRQNREEKFSSAKKFYDSYKKELGISYAYYAAIESSTKFPEITALLRIAQLLGIDSRLICHLWAKDQMPTQESKNYFEPSPVIEARGNVPYAMPSLDHYYVMSDHQAPAFLKNPTLIQVLSLVIAGLDKGISEEEILRVTGFPPASVHAAVDWLRNEGLAIVEDGRIKRKKRYFHMPNSEAFKKIRDESFLKSANELLPKFSTDDLLNKRALRVTFQRTLTEKQAADWMKMLDTTLAFSGSLPDQSSKNFYTLLIAFGKRYELSEGDEDGAGE